MGDLERQLQGLDEVAWAFLKKKLKPLLGRRHPTRGWQQLFDTINEARGYNFLLGAGCTCVEFIPESTVKNQETPDLKVCDQSGLVICEVKTINISEVEADRRTQGHVFTTKIHVDQGLLDKIASTIAKAKGQICAYLEGGPGKKIILMIINFDDSSHEYADDYDKQIREFLDKSQPAGMEVQLDIGPPFYTAKVS
ncbi:MAG TPA: hypothetical protein VKI44_17455 [Acetobacteraceae bacterium]|nr:hypothetical protein [Acetobacteraceae bacterium]